MLCGGNGFTFLYTSPYEHVQYNVSGPFQVLLSLTSVQKKIVTIIFVVKA